MMNLLAIGLVLTSVVTAGFFTPTAKTGEEDVIVKDGHRVVVVEYEKDDGSTKVLISPPNSPATDDGKQDEADRHGFRPRELVCDAYGKCKHKIAAAFEKTTGKTAEAAKDATERVKETVSQTATEASDKVKEVTETLSEKGGGLKEEAARKMEGAKERVKETVSQTASKTSDKVKEVTETLSEKGGGLKEEAARKMEGAKETVEEGVETSRRKRKEAEKELREILQNAGEVADDVLHYVAQRERAAPWAGVLHLMGFAAAYGMSLWITFASSYVLERALPKQQFAVVQSKIYPVYFKAMACGVGMALLGHLMGGGRRSVVVVQGMNLVSSMAMTLMNLLWLEPKATKVMLERMKKEKEEGAGKESHTTSTTTTTARAVDDTAGKGLARARIMELSQILQRQNSYSSFLNALTLVSLTWHLVNLGRRLQTPC